MRISFCRTARFVLSLVVMSPGYGFGTARAQQPTPGHASRNMLLESHLPMTGVRSGDVLSSATGQKRIGNLVVDQTQGRSLIYVARRFEPTGFDAVDISDPARPEIIFSWSLPGHYAGSGATDITYFEEHGKTYVVLGMRLPEDKSYGNLGAIVFDVSALPGGIVRETDRILSPGGLHHVFAYRHSSGSNLLFTSGGGAMVAYDLKSLTTGDHQVVSTLDVPESTSPPPYGFYSMFGAYHLTTETDRLYTSGGGGYYIFDISDIEQPVLLTSISSAAIQIGRAIEPVPDGSMVVTTAGYRTAPIRIFDLQPGLDSTISVIKTATGAWTSSWDGHYEQVAVRWPFVFVAAMNDGIQVFNMMNAYDPYTVGYQQTWDGPPGDISDDLFARTGTWDIDVRNRDGLIAATDARSGLWLLRMEAFEGWDGRGWGFPDISNAQNWKDGPTRSNEWDSEGGSR